MASPILLVCDDLATVATVKRVLGREGHELVLATNSADAVIAFGHHLPSAVLVDPAVEGDRGQIVLEELQNHPESKLLRVLLLGESLPGFGYPMVPLPIDTDTFLPVLNDTMRGGVEEPWQVFTSPRALAEEPPDPTPSREAPDQWRTTQHVGDSFGDASTSEPMVPVPAASPALPGHLHLADPEVPPPQGSPEPQTSESEAEAAPSTTTSGPPTPDLESALFGDLESQLGQEVEAEAIKSVESTLAAARQGDQELQQLEDEVRAEAARRRAARMERGVPPSAPEPPTADTSEPPAPVAADADELFGAEPPAITTPSPSEEDLFGDGEPGVPSAVTAPEPQLPPEPEAPPSPIAARPAPSAPSAALGRAQAMLDLAAADASARASTFAELEAQALRVPDLEAELAALKAEHQTLGISHQALGEEHARLSRDGEVSSESLAHANRQLAELGAELELVRQELTQARHLAATAEAKSREAGTAKRSLEGETQQLWGEYERLEKELAQVKAAFEAEQELRARDASEAQGAREKATVELAGLSSELALARDALEDARRESHEKEALLREGQRALERDKALAETEWRGQVEQLRLDLAALQEAHAQLRAQLDVEREGRADAEAAQTELKKKLLEAQQEVRMAVDAAREDAKANYGAERDSVMAQLAQAQARMHEAEGNLARVMAEHDGVRELVVARERELETALAKVEAAQAEAEAARETLKRAGADYVQRQSALDSQVAELTARVQSSNEKVTTLEQALARVEIDKNAAVDQQQRLNQALEALREKAEETRARAETAETVARQAVAKADEAEAKTILSLPLPSRPPLGVKRFGTLDLAGLARLAGQLVLAKAEVRLELAVPGGRRTVWLKGGNVVAAESSFPQESLVDRARRDGLLDARQERELQPVKSATAHEALVILKGRGYLRDAEGPPLVQRHTEAVALEAFSESSSDYRLTEESPGPEVLAARLPRATLPLLAESLRRALPADELLERLGGGEAVPYTIDGELDPRSLGFGEKERRMLGYVDGEATVEDLTLASGLKPDAAWRALLVAKLVGLVDVKVPEIPAPTPSPELDVQRLESKYEQVMEADYFTVLGLERNAGSDEVRRAFDRLAEEFDPIRYSGHPDASLQQRAQVVFEALEEAAKALADERRRENYARHLVD